VLERGGAERGRNREYNLRPLPDCDAHNACPERRLRLQRAGPA